MLGKLKGPLIVFAAAAIGEYVAENFVIKDGPGDRGFINRTDGFGLDEIARAAIIAGLATLGLRMFRKG